jgi:hypothetical protein
VLKEHALSDASEESVEVMSACVCRKATGIRRVRRVGGAVEGAAGIHVARVFHISHLRVGQSDSVFRLRRADVELVRDAVPVRERGDACALDVGGERRRVGLTELSEDALVSLDGGGGVRFGGGVFRGGSGFNGGADGCEAECGDRGEEVQFQFHIVSKTQG